MSDAPFRPFDTHLDRQAAVESLRETLSGAEDGELFLERRRSEGLLFDDGHVKQASYDAHEGFGLRAVRGETAGYAHSTEISESALKRAGETARLAVGAGGGTLAAGPAKTNRTLYTDVDPIAGRPFAAKVETLAEIDAYLRELDPRVVQATVSIAASLQEVAILRADDSLVTDVRPMTRVNVSVIVEENGRRESGSAGGGGRRQCFQIGDERAQFLDRDLDRRHPFRGDTVRDDGGQSVGRAGLQRRDDRGGSVCALGVTAVAECAARLIRLSTLSWGQTWCRQGQQRCNH